MWTDRVKALHLSLDAQQSMFTRRQSSRDDIMVNKLIAKKLKPVAEGEFVKTK